VGDLTTPGVVPQRRELKQCKFHREGGLMALKEGGNGTTSQSAEGAWRVRGG